MEMKQTKQGVEAQLLSTWSKPYTIKKHNHGPYMKQTMHHEEAQLWYNWIMKTGYIVFM